jgi:uncharacterized protein
MGADCGSCSSHATAPASTGGPPLLQIGPPPGQPRTLYQDGSRDGLPWGGADLPGQDRAALTRVYGSADALPRASVRPDGFQLETNVQLLELGDGAFCLNHALRQQQLFGGRGLRDAYQHLEASRPVDGRFMEVLLAAGFVVSPGARPDEEHRRLLALEDQKEAVEPSLTLLRILLTDICNLSCSYCKVIPNVQAPQRRPTDDDRLAEVVRFFFEHSEEPRPKIIHITGGEPTLFFDQVRHIVHLKESLERPQENCWLVIGTNATLIDPERAQFLADHDVKCIVSMDGPQEVHDLLRRNHGGRGSWKMVDRGIRELRAAGAEVSLSMVLGRHNLDQAQPIITWFLDEYQPTGLGVNFMKPPTPDQADFDQLIDPDSYADRMYEIHKTFRDHGLFLELVYRKLQPFVTQRYRFHDCGAAGGTNLNVDSKGNVGPCKSFLVMNKLAMRNLNISAYRDAVVAQWRKRSPIYYEFCEGCAARGMCGNGCAYDAMIHAGDEMAIDVRSCQYTKRFNRLFIEDLFRQVRPDRIEDDWLHLPSREERQRLFGRVEAIPRTLSYSIGHQTME